MALPFERTTSGVLTPGSDRDLEGGGTLVDNFDDSVEDMVDRANVSYSVDDLASTESKLVARGSVGGLGGWLRVMLNLSTPSLLLASTELGFYSALGMLCN